LRICPKSFRSKRRFIKSIPVWVVGKVGRGAAAVIVGGFEAAVQVAAVVHQVQVLEVKVQIDVVLKWEISIQSFRSWSKYYDCGIYNCNSY
jgi:hypothetical protein